MESELDKEARGAAQGLLDIAIEAGKRASGSRDESQLLSRSTREGPPAKIAAFRPVVSSMMGSGRIITSGNTPPVLSRLEKDSGLGLKSPEWRTKEKFAQPKPRREQERVTLIVARPRTSDEGEPAEPSADVGPNFSPRSQSLSPRVDAGAAEMGAQGTAASPQLGRAMSNPLAANTEGKGAELRRTSTDLSRRVRDLGRVTESDRKTSFDLPVPPSAFALRVSGAETIAPKDSLPGNQEIELDALDLRPDSASLHQPQAKRPKLDRAPSIGSLLAQAQGRSLSAPQSFSALKALNPPSKWQAEGVPNAISAPQDSRQNLFGGSSTGKSSAFLFKEPAFREPKDSNLMPRNSSDRSTLDVHKQLAQQISSETVTNLPPRGSTQAKLPGGESAFTIRDPSFKEPTGTTLPPSQVTSKDAQMLREMQDSVQSLRASAVRSMEDPSRLDAARFDPPQLIGSAVSVGDDSQGSLPPPLPVTPTPQNLNLDLQMDVGTPEESETTLWSGLIKHRLKTANGSSVAELFSLSAMIPSKLVEQFPSTIFVNALVGRSKVKLGKHYAASCKLASPTERQIQKVTALASMKLVAICELQHCTFTLVPNVSDQGLQMVAFIIADE